MPSAPRMARVSAVAAVYSGCSRTARTAAASVAAGVGPFSVAPDRLIVGEEVGRKGRCAGGDVQATSSPRAADPTRRGVSAGAARITVAAVCSGIAGTGASLTGRTR